jgi:curved DNA-binding protein
MKFKDYYRTMGVEPAATAEEIKTAYRKLARKYHPDVNKEPDSHQRFTDLGEANDALKDPARRAAYDQLRAAGWRDGQEMDAPTQESAHRGGPNQGDLGDFSDFFQSLYGRQSPGGGQRRGFRRQAMHERGEDINATFMVSLDDAYHGGERQFTLQVPTFGEQGESVSRQRTISVKIPAGITSGTKMRLRGQGHPGTTTELNGDLYLEITVTPHRLFRVDGSNLSLEVPIAPWEAVLGAQIVVPTMGGNVTVTIPAGAQEGQKLRLKGRGLPGDPPGDQFLTLNVVVPTSATDKAKALYQDLATESAFAPRVALGV